MTVKGPVDFREIGVTDAHTHVWIAPVAGISPGLPQLSDQDIISAELDDYRKAGGGTLVDCQPGGCGRDGGMLARLSDASGVHIVACTGFHLEKYYPPHHWLWETDTHRACSYFVSEIEHGRQESSTLDQMVKAGFIKIACGATVEQSPAALVEAAVHAQYQTGVALEVHTERGAGAEQIVNWLDRLGVDLNRLVLCHIDKRADFGLHCELANEGVLLEYDTFYRPKYEPDRNVWPLLEKMVGGGFQGQIALATDMAEPELWSRFGGAPGLVGIFTRIIPRLRDIGFEPETVESLVGQNIAVRLAQDAGEKLGGGCRVEQTA